ncbi:MAG: hypothetical protein ABIP57_15060 [Jatrophihabitantaceae bacterium]
MAILAALLLWTISAGSASATSVFPPSGSHGITPQAPYWGFSDGNGHGSAQVNYARSPYIINMGYQLSPSNIAICTGNLNETLDLYQTGRKVLHDNHVNAGCSYFAHPSYAQGGLYSYQMQMHFVFRVSVGGRTGTATVDAIVNFQVTLV